MTESRSLAIGISRNVPNLEGSICRASENRLFSSKEANACYLVRVSHKLVYLFSQDCCRMDEQVGEDESESPAGHMIDVLYSC